MKCLILAAKRGMARHEGMVDKTTDRDHGQTSVLELCQCQSLAFGGILAETQGIKAKVPGLALSVRKHVHLRHLPLVEGEFQKPTEEEDLNEGLGSDLEEGFDPVGLRVQVSWEADKFLDHEAQEGKHCNAAWGTRGKRGGECDVRR